MKIAFVGATGFIGRAAINHLARQGHEVVALVRRPKSAEDLPCKTVAWSAAEAADSLLGSVLREADAVINLAGEPIAESRWTSESKKRLRSSRVDVTRWIVDAIAKLPEHARPKALLNGSAIGYYGDRGDSIISEDSDSGADFLSQLCVDWEAEALRAEQLGIRVVRLRTGVVLGRDGGALQKMQPVTLGRGLQWMSWIHIEDQVRFLEYALNHSDVRGAYNLVAPNPVQNRELCGQLAKSWGFPFPAVAPRFLIELALGEMSCVVLASCRVRPQRLLDHGFSFSYPTLEQALGQIYPAGNALEQTLSVTQFVPKPLEEVFSFFSRAENLEEITLTCPGKLGPG